MSAGQVAGSVSWCRSCQRGFTLIELMVAIALLAMIATIAIPSFAGLMREQRLVHASNDLLAAVNLARSEAIKRGEETRMCALPECAGVDWSRGWQLQDSAQAMLHTWQADSGGVRITSNRDQVDFDGMGRLAGEATLELTLGERRREISISRSGLARVERASSGAGS